MTKKKNTELKYCKGGKLECEIFNGRVSGEKNLSITFYDILILLGWI